MIFKNKLLQMAEMNPDKSKHADTIIRNHVVWSMGAGFIPVLIADIFAVSALQLDMIRQMCKVYDKDFSESQGKAIVTSLTSSTVARLAARSVIKLIPGVGSIIGGVTVSIFAGASTYALGEVFKKHFESGGTILDFDPERVKKLYKEKFEKGKKVAEEWRKKQKEEPVASEGGFRMKTDATKGAAAERATDTSVDEEREKISSIAQRLKELNDLKEAGVITEEEYSITKKRLLEDFGK